MSDVKAWGLGAVVGLLIICVAGGVSVLAWQRGYQRGAEDASCYALLIGRALPSNLPLDMAPCPQERGPQP